MTNQMSAAADKGLGFTAAATGTYTARVEAGDGGGGVTATVVAVGTAVERAPELRGDARPHALAVSCYLSD